MDKKIAYCVFTRNRPDVVQEFLNKSYSSYKNNGIDVIFIDSSNNCETENVLKKYIDDKDVAYYKTDYSTELSEKIWNFMCETENMGYDYIWPAGDVIQYTDKGIKTILKNFNDDADLFFLDHLTTRTKKNELVIYKDINSFFADNMWRSSLLGCAIINVETMIKGINHELYKEVFCGERLKGWAINFFYFNRIAELETFTGCCINVEEEVKFSIFKTGNHWRKNAFSIMCETWVNVIEDLPEIYENKEKILRQSAFNAIIGNAHQYVALKRDGVYSPAVFFKYFNVWNRVTYLSRIRLFMISLYPRSIFYIKQIVKTNIIKREIKKIRKNNKYLVIYGTGLYGLKYAQFLNKMNIEFDYFCVTDKNQGQVEFESHKIRQLNELSGEELKETGFVIAMGPRYTKEVKRNLDLLVSQRQIYSDTIGRKIATIDECIGYKFIAGDAWY